MRPYEPAADRAQPCRLRTARLDLAQSLRIAPSRSQIAAMFPESDRQRLHAMRAADHGCAKLFRSSSSARPIAFISRTKNRVGNLHLQHRRGVGTSCVVGPK